MLVIIDVSPSSKFFSSGMWEGGLVELKPNVSFSSLAACGFKKKNALHLRFFRSFSVLSMNVFKYCFSLHIDMFFVEYPKFICSGERSWQRSQAFLSAQQLVLELVYTRSKLSHHEEECSIV